MPDRRAARTVGIVLGMLCLSMSLLTQPLAQVGNKQRNPNPLNTERFSAEQIRNAQPLPLPIRGQGDRGRLRPQEVLDGPVLDKRASPPRQEIGDALYERLFLPEDDREQRRSLDRSEPLAPLDQTATGAIFSHSRVFPKSSLRFYPYRTVGLLIIRDGAAASDEVSVCSGAVIERRLVATAAHCLFTFDGEPRFFADFTFIPAYDRGEAPYGRWDWSQAAVSQSWFDGDGANEPPNLADVGILVIADRQAGGRTQAIGDVTGKLGLRTGSFRNEHVTMLGYAGNLDDGERMQRTDAQTFRIRRSIAAEFGTPQGSGSSGGPFVRNFGVHAKGQTVDGGNRLVGIKSYSGPDGRKDLRIGGSSFLNDEFVAIYNDLCDDDPGNCP